MPTSTTAKVVMMSRRYDRSNWPSWLFGKSDAIRPEVSDNRNRASIAPSTQQSVPNTPPIMLPVPVFDPIKKDDTKSTKAKTNAKIVSAHRSRNVSRPRVVIWFRNVVHMSPMKPRAK